MEPESRTRRKFIWLVVVTLLGIGGFVAYQRIMQTDRAQKLADRFDPWYEADAPPGGIVMEARPVEPVSPQRDPQGDEAPPAATPKPRPAAPRPAAPRPAAPRPAPTRTPAARITAPAPRPVARLEPEPVEPGKLFVSSTPWGTLYVDGRPMGNTPLSNVTVTPGTRFIRISHDGYEPYERQVEIAPGQQVRLTGIQLQETRR